ncbi:MAG: GNAT family N-acetyltransferase [Roseburia inulinivorans]
MDQYFCRKKEEQGKGYGTMVLNQVCQSLHKNGINKIYVGQDFNNFFSEYRIRTKEKKYFSKKWFYLKQGQTF